MRFLRLLSLLLIFAPAAANANELKKADAAKLLAFTGCRNAQVAAVVNGVAVEGALTSPNLATAMALCERNGRIAPETKLFFYDTDLGWFYFELDNQGQRIRLWTTSGYREVKADRAAEIAKARAALDALEPERKELERLSQGGDPAALIRARQIRERLSAAEEALRRAEKLN